MLSSIIGIITITSAYLFQLIKLIKVKDTINIAISSYFIGAISYISLYLNTNNIYFKYLTIIGLIETLIIFFTILYYDLKNKKMKIEIIKSKPLIIGGIFSLIGVFGVAQAVKCLLNKEKISHVDYKSYIIWLIYGMILIILSDTKITILSSILSTFFYMIVIYFSFIKRKNY